MIRSSFAGFTTARLGLSASQSALEVTGQNITNINTKGYTRQRVDLMSFNLGNGTDQYTSVQDTYIGYGVLVGGVSQIRDPFLDVRYRTEIANVGYHDEKAQVLTDLVSILDEVGKDGSINNQISALSTSLNKLTTQVGNKEFDNIVKSSAEMLTKLFNRYSKQIETVRSDCESGLQKIDVPEVNDILKNIRNLNETIKTNQLHGNPSLELQDQRNLLIDDLATYAKIDVKYTPTQVPNSSIYLDELKITMVGSTQNFTLVDDCKPASQFSCTKNASGQMELNLVDNGVSTNVNSDLLTGSLKASLDLLNCSGEFDLDPTSPKGIGYYSKMLDTLAVKVATVMNDANQYTDDTGVVHQYDLFGTNDGQPLSAKNISIATDWATGVHGLVATKDPKQTVGASDNILHMITQLTAKFDYKTTFAGPPSSDRTLFKGSFQECMTNIGSVLGLEKKSEKATLDTYVAVTTDLSNSRDSISGVSLDEEGINLLQYQKSYSAAARLMTTLDEAMDTILGMGVVGR